MTTVTRARPSWWDAAAVPAPPPAPAPAIPVDPVERFAPDTEVAPLLNDPKERLAILAEGAGVLRPWAEGFTTVCAMAPPAGFSPKRWRQLIDAAGAFLGHWGAAAIGCGWSDLDVFGCHQEAPTARLDSMGLGSWLVAVKDGDVEIDGPSTTIDRSMAQVIASTVPGVVKVRVR